MAYDSKRKKLFSFGGFANNNSLADLRVLENGEWKTLSNDTSMKAAEPGFVYDADRDKLISFGGSGRRGVVNGITWQWDGSAWKKFEGAGPEGRQGFVMVYDSKRKKTVLFGGMDGAGKFFYDDVWEFDGVHWQKITGKGMGPGPRLAAGAAYDSKRGIVLIFGGISHEITKGDTWGWNGKEWTKLADDGPAPRTMGYMAYDKIRDRTVLFGGRLGWPNDVDDTWEWDGITWKEIK
ncbi:MAG: Kelch repeat-containing protein [Chitinophagaceae bacterium]